MRQFKATKRRWGSVVRPSIQPLGGTRSARILSRYCPKRCTDILQTMQYLILGAQRDERHVGGDWGKIETHVISAVVNALPRKAFVGQVAHDAGFPKLRLAGVDGAPQETRPCGALDTHALLHETWKSG